MVIDIVYDDTNYFWNQDYKELFTKDHVELLADKHKMVKHDMAVSEFLLRPSQVKDNIELAINRDYIASSL